MHTSGQQTGTTTDDRAEGRWTLSQSASGAGNEAEGWLDAYCCALLAERVKKREGGGGGLPTFWKSKAFHLTIILSNSLWFFFPYNTLYNSAFPLSMAQSNYRHSTGKISALAKKAGAATSVWLNNEAALELQLQ